MPCWMAELIYIVIRWCRERKKGEVVGIIGNCVVTAIALDKCMNFIFISGFSGQACIASFGVDHHGGGFFFIEMRT